VGTALVGAPVLCDVMKHKSSRQECVMKTPSLKTSAADRHCVFVAGDRVDQGMTVDQAMGVKKTQIVGS